MGQFDVTTKQDNFARYIFEGLSQRDAYRKAYDCEGSSDEVVDVNASRLMDDTKVALRIQQLRDALAAKAIAPLSKRMAILAEIAEHPIEMPVSAGHKLAAVAEMNKVEGVYPASKHLIAEKVQIEVVHVTRQKQTE